MSEWQDISTAPRDGTHVDLYFPGKIGRKTDWWFSRDPIWGGDGEWISEYRECGQDLTAIYPNTKPTHWMPLPTPPQDKT